MEPAFGSRCQCEVEQRQRRRKPDATSDTRYRPPQQTYPLFLSLILVGASPFSFLSLPIVVIQNRIAYSQRKKKGRNQRSRSGPRIRTHLPDCQNLGDKQCASYEFHRHCSQVSSFSPSYLCRGMRQIQPCFESFKPSEPHLFLQSANFIRRR